MNCPVCKKTMADENFGGVNVEVCREGCKGMWFDWGALAKLDDKNKGMGQALQEALHFPRVNDENRGAINCPKCGIPMHRHFYQSSKQVNVDECYQCGGFFLDSGELTEIRNRHMSQQEQSEYRQKLLNNLPAYRQELEDQRKNKVRAEAILRFTKFLGANYFIPED